MAARKGRRASAAARGTVAPRTAQVAAAGAPGAGKAPEAAVAGAAGNAAAKGARKRGPAVRSTRVRDRARLSQAMAPAARRRLFAQSTALDFVLVLVVATTLALTVSFGFNSAWEHRGNVALVVAMEVPLLAAMYLGTWSRRMMAPSIVATAVVAVALVAGAIALSPPGGEMAALVPGTEVLGDVYALNDVPENYGIFAMVVVACTVLSFLLSRRTGLLVGLLVGYVLACGVVQYLYRDWAVGQPGIAIDMVGLFALAMLLVYHNYRQSVYTASRARGVSFPGAFAYAALIGAACVLVGVAVFYGMVAAADLFTPDVRIWQEYVSPPTTTANNKVDDIHHEGDERSDVLDDAEQDDGEEGAGGAKSGTGGSGSVADDAFAQAVATLAGYDLQNMDEQDWEVIEYLVLQWKLILGVTLAILAIVAAVLLQRARRGWRLRRIARRSGAYQVWFLYTFLLGRLRRLGIRKPRNLTPLEFATSYAKALRPFSRGTEGVDFADVSMLYQDVAFGGIEPDEEQVQAVRGYYRAFFGNARRKVGWPKWALWKFWRI